MTEISRTRTILLALTVGSAYVTWGLLISLQPPFYPSEAEKKGATPSQYGLVFGVFNLAAFIFSPIFGRYGTKFGLKFLYNTGAFIQALAGIGFGFLDYIQDTNTFLGISYLLRIVGGIADAASIGAVLSILMKLFPKYVSTVVSWCEMGFGLGMMLGPALGSALYELGGFSLPFLSVGGTVLVLAVLLVLVVPSVHITPRDKTDSTTKSLTYTAVFKNPAILAPFLDNFICFCGNGMVESMLEPHLKNAAGATQFQTGMTFLILGGVYMLSTPIIGQLCDRIRYPILVSIAGNCLMAVCFLLIGPAPYLSLEPTPGLIQGSVAICGLGYGMILVSTFGRSQKSAIRKGFNDDIDTYLIVTGMWSSSLYMGNFFGPTFAGILVEKFGFRMTTVVFFSLYIFVTLFDFVEFFHLVRVNKRIQSFQTIVDKSEKDPRDLHMAKETDKLLG